MIRLLQRLLDPAYLYAVSPGPLGRWGIVYVTWAISLIAGLGASLWWKSRTRHAATTITAWACGVGLAFLGLRFLAPQAHHLPPHARFLLLEAWTARVWPISATLVAILVPVAYVLSRLDLPPVLQRQVNALACVLAPDDPPLSRWQSAFLGGLHLVGLAWLWHTAGYPIWWALPTLLLLSLLPLITRPHRWRIETLAPFFLSYLFSIVYFVLSQKLHVNVEDYQGFALPDPLSPWFNVPAMVAVSIVYTLLIQGKWMARQTTIATRAKILPAALVVVVALWLASTVAVHHTYGVTASDPYCYVQMTIDLAETGSPLHDFALAGLARELGLPTWPTVHIGYHPPFFANRSPTMWPIGWPLLMVPFYRLGGLRLLYFVAPLTSALALVVTWFLTGETLHAQPRTVRWTVAALAVFLTATSPEGAERLLVPMADASAQLFTLLTLWLLLHSQRDRPALYGLLAGASFGVAFFIRHPQLPLGLAALGTALVKRQPLKRRLSLLIAFGLAACIVVLPDFVYRKSVFGNWSSTESTEWFLLSINNVGKSFLAILQQGLLRREELGFIVPFAIYGGWSLWRKHPRPAWVLLAGSGAVFAFHLCYEALRPRDLIAIFPVLYLCAAYGFVALWKWTQNRSTLGRAILLTCSLTLLLARSYRSLAMPWRDDVITFGHVSKSQYQTFVELASLTPESAVIGSMLNSGAIELHAGRAAVHPSPWTKDELHLWIDALLSQNRSFYILDDGEEMPNVLSRLHNSYQVLFIQTLDLPYFAHGGGNIPRLGRLYKIEPLP